MTVARLAARDVLHRLSGVKRQTSGWIAKCPAHEDNRQSLSVGEGEEIGGIERVLAYCHAGCSFEEICEALGIEPRQLGGSANGNGGRHIATTYDYVDERGQLVHQTVRYWPKDFRQRRPDGSGGWIWSLRGINTTLYRLPQVLQAVRNGVPIYLVEGESDVHTAERLGLVATTAPMGAGKWRRSYTKTLTGAEVRIIADCDDAGRRHAETVQRELAGTAASASILPIVEMQAGDDLSDLAMRLGDSRTLTAIDDAASRAVEADSPPSAPGGRRSVAQRLLDCCEALNVELCHAPDGRAYMGLPLPSGGRQIAEVTAGTKDSRTVLTHILWQSEQTAISDTELVKVQRTLQAQAEHDCPERDVYLRVGGDPDRVWIDLGDSAWSAVEIDADGWRVVTQPGAWIRRAKGTQPLPKPERGGAWSDFFDLVNLATDQARALAVGWLLGASYPTGPYPILHLEGEQGSAKSSVAEALRSLIDPRRPSLRRPPREERSLMSNALHSWVLAYDNLSHIQPWMSDALCVLSTGGGWADRELHTTTDEVLVEAERPTLITGIGGIIVKDDLIDRALVVNLPQIPPRKRFLRDEYRERLETIRPKVLGLVCDAIASAIRERGKRRLKARPRLADWAEFVTAAEVGAGLPWSSGTILAAYSAMRAEVVGDALEGNVVANALRDHMEAKAELITTMSELKESLEGRISDVLLGARAWPKTDRAFQARIYRASAFLRAVGIYVEKLGRGSTGRTEYRIVNHTHSNVRPTSGTHMEDEAL